jgi:hypothetical protein
MPSDPEYIKFTFPITTNNIYELAACWIAQGSGFESQRGHVFFAISPRGKISQEGFSQALVSLSATSRVSEDNFRGSARVSEWMLAPVKKDGGLVFHNLNGCIRTINLNK